MKHLYFSVGIFVVLYAGLGFNLMAQSARTNGLTEPLKINSVDYEKSLKHKAAKSVTSENWFNSLNIEVENLSEKTVVFAEFKIELIGKQAPKLSKPLVFQYGKLDDSLRNVESEVLLSGARVKLNISQGESNITAQKALLKSGYVPESDEIRIRLGKIIFEDKTAWANGRLFSPDLEDSNKWIVADFKASKRYFDRDFFNSFNRVEFMPVSAKISQTGDCGTYAGFQILYDCCSDILVFSDTVNYKQPGNATLTPVTDTCPTGETSCVFYSVVPCS